MFYPALFLAKLVDWLIQSLHLGAGSTWPGEVALHIDPSFVQHLAHKTALKFILVVGTNGKTTTAALITHGLQKQRMKVICNPEGANLLNGVASMLAKNSSMKGEIISDYAILELDENALSQVVSQIHQPDCILFLNLFRDQLDRYGEVHTIVKRWQRALGSLSKSTTLIVNGDDPRLVYMAKQSALPTIYFGSDKDDKSPKEIPHDVDSIHCPACGSKLIYFAMSYSHLGDYACRQCGFSAPERWMDSIEQVSTLLGVYNRYNIRAAVSVLHTICSLDFTDARKLLDGFQPAFGRQERLTALHKEWIVILSKNPAGFNQSINALGEIVGTEKTDIAIILNDRIPDGTDISWIWDVEFDHVYDYATSVVVSGDRTFDMAIRMEAGEHQLFAEPILKNALELLAKKHTSAQPIIILATYSAMLEVRKILKGRALL